MESKRKQFYKHTIKTICEQSQIKENTKNDVNNINKKKKVFHHSTKDSNYVTVLGSSSYHNQNKDLSIFYSMNDKHNDKLENITDNEVAHKKEFQSEDQCGGSKETEIFEEDQCSKYSSTEIHEITIEIEQITEDNLVPEHYEKTDIIKPKAMENFELLELDREAKRNTKNYSRMEKNCETSENIEEAIEQEYHDQEIEQEIGEKDIKNLSNSENRNHSIEQNIQKTNQTNNSENHDQPIIEQESDDVFVTIVSEENRTDSNENLQPTITDVIPENEMNIMRKSLENDDANDIEIPKLTKEVQKKKKRSKRAVIQKSYIDFISEDEDFTWDSSSWMGTDESSSEEDLPKKKKKPDLENGKVGEAGLSKKKANKKKTRKENRSKGKSYEKKDGSIAKERQIKPNPCIGKKCPWKCGEISEEKRESIFKFFWGLSAQRKKEWLLAMSSRHDVKRKRSVNSNLRTNTFNYFVNEEEGRRQVCLQFLISTLDVTQRYIYYTLTNASQGISKEDTRGRCIPANKTPNDVKESAKNFIKSLPALPSHYCRKDSTRLYLPTEYKNIKNLYRVYKEDRTSKGVDIVSEKIFRQIFTTDFNLGFHVPKKDKCLKCLRFEGQHPDNCPELRDHLEEKEASKLRFEFHRKIGQENPSILCTSFDLQKVLNTPYGNSMLLFYSRKYTVYNLCFYESITRNGFCFVWGESEGKRGANEISTILEKYIEDVDSRTTIKCLILYSDSCPGQNKNKIVLAAVHNALLQSKNLETIQMNFLLPGHTEMPVDSIHSTIENSVRNITVWAPSQWLTICQLARKEPKAYFVENLTHNDFKNFEDFSNKYFKGNLIGKISKVRTATFKKSTPNIIKIKYTMKNDALEENIPIHAKPKAINLKYKSTLPITKAKYNDLKKLCDTRVIPKIFHAEYLSMENYNGKDELLDTDIEDETKEAD